MSCKSITKQFFTRILPLLLFSSVVFAPQQAEAASCAVTLNWSGGWCDICGGPTGNYACNPPSCSPCGSWGPRTFTDCVPPGNVVTQICATVSFVSCGSAGNFFIALNGTTIGTRPSGGTNCACGSCETWSTCRSDPCPGGFPGYVYGGTNSFLLDVIPTTSFCLARVVLTITYAPTTPPTPAPIAGPTSPCVGSTQTYSIPAVSGATSYSWTVPGGWSINSGQGTTSISVTAGAAAGNVCVTANNACGSSVPRCLSVTPISAPALPGAITGTTTPCVGASVTYNISAVSGASSYTWTVPAGWAITGGQGTTSITVTVGSASGNVCVRSCNSCGCSAFNCVAVTPTPVPAAPGSISGLTSPCAGNSVTYSISAVGGATSYQWTVPPGWTITSGQGTTSITVTAGAGSGNVCVRACNGCGCSGFTCVAVTPGAAPATPGTISGPTSVCAGSTTTYSITAVSGATSYTWTVPAGWTLNSGQGTTSINVTAAGAGGSITVQACNSCGCSGTQSLAVTLATITAPTTAVDESCNGGCDGSVSVAPTGTPPFTYAWSNGCTTSSCGSLCAGTYTVTVTDASGCSAVGSAAVLTGPAVLAGFSYNGNQCLAGNSFCFTNLGSAPPATYAWDFGDGIGISTAENPCYTYAASGSYLVQQTVTNSSGVCNDVSFTTVVVYADPVAAIVGSDVSCNGACDGFANLTVTSGQAPFGYLWSSGQTTEDIGPVCAGTYNVTVTDANSCQAIATVVLSEPAVLTATPTGTMVLCNGACTGDATATGGGGTAPYNYVWDDPALQTTTTASGLCAGTYNATITDANGCIAVTSQVITEPAPMVLTFTPVDATCGLADGSVCVAVAGGSAPYNYIWDDPGLQTNNCALALFGGAYNVTVTDVNGCVVAGNTTVSTSVSVTASISASTMVLCNGGTNGSATVLAIGGTLPYAYSWDDPALQTNAIATNLPAGTWTATVVDNAGCIASVSVTITEPALLSAAILASNDPNCNGGCDGDATVTVSGGTGTYIYAWTPTGGTAATGTALCAGIYTVTISDDNGCIATDNITLGEPTVVTSSIVGTNVSCAGGSDGIANLTPGGGIGPYNFLWSTGATSEDLINVNAGTYCVTVTDNQACTSTACVTLTEAAAIAVTTTVVDAYCGLPNGSACPAPLGGTPPYTYLWDDPLAQTDSCAINLLGGITYNVIITDANGCTGTAAAVINDLPPAVTVATVDNNASGFLVCDGQATGTMTGGIAPFTYLWDDPLAQTTATASGLCAGTHCVTIIDAAGCSAGDCITITEPAAITLVLTGTNLTCNASCDGTADVTVVGGVPPYIYSWAPGGMTTPIVIGLCADWYVVTVTDNNSIVTIDSIEITEPAVLAIAMSGNDAVCNGVCDGDASGALAGGTPPYIYLWDDPAAQTTAIASGLCAGVHTLTVTDTNGCVANNSFTVNEPVAIVLSESTVPATCGQSDGSATVTVTNGVPALTYLWDGGQTSSTATGFAAGTYQVIVTDGNGCQDSITSAVANTAGPVVIISDSTDVTCFGVCDGAATALASGGTAPYTYAWTPGGQTTVAATFLCAGTHIVQVTDGTGCTSSASVVIDEPANLVASGAVLTDPNCNGSCDGVATVSVIGGSFPNVTYQWDDPALQTLASATSLCANTYSVVVIDTNGCIATATVTLVEPLALSLSISTVDPGCNGGCEGTALVTATGGVTPYTYAWSNGDNTPLADSLCANSYVINVTDANGCASISTTTINNPPALVASLLTSQNAACNGGCDGFATVTQSGGTPPYTYNWSDGQVTATATFLCVGTYGVTISDANGCTDTTSVTIDQPSTLVLGMSKTNVLCNGDCNGTATVTANGGIPPFTYQWNDPLFQTTATAGSLCDGVFDVIVTDSSGCNTSAFVLITEPNALSIIVASTTSSTCGNQNGGACVNIAGGQFPYYVEWSDPLSTIGTCVSNVFAGIYKVYVLDNNGCFDSLFVPINDIGAPSIDSITTTPDNCYGDSVGTASVDSVTGNSGGDTYYWVNFNGDTIASGVGVTSVSGLAGGTYSVSIEDGITGCITSVVVIISQPSPLNTAIFPTNIIDVSCNGLCDGSLTVNASGGTGAYTYSWLPTSTDVTPMADSLCGGQHIVFVTDADGCIDSSVATVGDPPAINVIATVTPVSCFGNNDGIIDLVPTPTGGTPPYAYVWLPSGIAGNVQTATNLAAGTDTVITTDLNGCTETTIVTVGEPAELLFTDITAPDFCGSAQGQATVTPSGGTPAYTYAWNTNPPQADSNAIGLLAGTYIVTVSDANGCTKSGPVTVPGTPGPIIDSAIVINVGCNGDATGSATVLVTSGTLPFTYVWDDPALQSTQTATGLLAGQFICTVTDVTGCQDIAVVTVVEPPPIVVLMFADPYSLICFGESVVISTVILGGVNPVVRAWDHGLPDSSAHLVSPIVTDTFNVFISDANGCQDTGSIKITVSPPLVVTATPLIEICIGQSAILWARPSAGNGGPYTVIWDDGITTTTVSVNAGDSTSITVSPLVNTSYTVVVTDSCSLNDTAYAFVAITELPDVIFSSAQSTGCDITFTDQSVAYSSLGPPNSIYIDTWEWDFGDGTGIGPGSGTVIGSPTTSGTYTNPTHQYVADGVYDVTVTIVDIKGCTSTMTITAMITVSAPQANFSYDPITVIKDQIIQFTDLSTGNIIGWSWNFGDTLGSGSSLQNPTHAYTDTGSYDVLLAVIDSNGCVDTIIRTITVTDQLVIYVPNIFAPDDQNQSQMLYVSGIGITSLNFIIYDRWGEKVFESTTATPRDRPDGKGNWYGEGWDGTMNGKEMSAQVFVYYLEADLQDGESVIKKGNITLIR